MKCFVALFLVLILILTPGCLALEKDTRLSPSATARIYPAPLALFLEGKIDWEMTTVANLWGLTAPFGTLGLAYIVGHNLHLLCADGPCDCPAAELR